MLSRSQPAWLALLYGFSLVNPKTFFFFFLKKRPVDGRRQTAQ